MANGYNPGEPIRSEVIAMDGVDIAIIVLLVLVLLAATGHLRL
jgi:uncharacterized protein YggT (Ycf19 family)